MRKGRGLDLQEGARNKSKKTVQHVLHNYSVVNSSTSHHCTICGYYKVPSWGTCRLQQNYVLPTSGCSGGVHGCTPQVSLYKSHKVEESLIILKEIK